MCREKTHVKIGRNESGGHTLIVDGHDLSYKVLGEGFAVEFAASPEQPDRVSVVLAADTLDIDLPESIVEANRETARQIREIGEMLTSIENATAGVHRRIAAEVNKGASL